MSAAEEQKPEGEQQGFLPKVEMPKVRIFSILLLFWCARGGDGLVGVEA